MVAFSIETYLERSGWSGGSIHKLDNSTWGSFSSYNRFEDNGNGLAWEDCNITLELGEFSGGVGTKIIELNSSGVSSFKNAAVGGADGVNGDEVNLVLQGFSSGDYTKACKLSKVIKATITYTT